MLALPPRWRLMAVFACLGTMACSDAQHRDSAEGHGLGVGAMGDAGRGDGPAADTDSEGGDSGVDEGGTWADAGLARGIGLVRVEANQGVAIPLLGADGAVPIEKRMAPLVAGRTTLFRAHWTLAVDWMPREIEAELAVIYADGTVARHVQTRFIDASPEPSILGGALDWILEPDAVRPAMRYSVALREIEGEGGGATLGFAPRFPAEDAADLGVDGSTRELRIVFVPAHVNGTVITSTEAGKAEVEDMLMATSPVQRVDVTWHDPVLVDGRLEAVADALNLLDQVRSADDADPDVYYHLLLHRDGCCNEDEFTFLGLGGVAGPGLGAVDVAARNAIVLSRDGTPQTAMSTIIHELGHNQGLPHAPCGGAGAADPEFPYPDAGIGVEGFDIMLGQLISSVVPRVDGGHADFMGYCWPGWYSDYNWGKNAARAEKLSRSVAASRREHVMYLRALVHPDGRPLQWVPFEGPALDQRERLRAAGQVRFRADGAQMQDMPLFLVALSEGGLSLALTPVPPALDSADWRVSAIAGLPSGPTPPPP